MAGMLPGVECARRRRLHQSGGWSDSPTAPAHGWTRRSSFCLYTSNNETHHTSSSSFPHRSILNQAEQDERLGGVAREAKERLDERLRTQRKSEIKRQSSNGSSRCEGGKSRVQGEVQREVVGLKKSGSKRFSWAKFSWKDSDQEECAICLEKLEASGAVAQLSCAHRFHARCLVPWLENNAHCPCCRMGIP